jgi:hypothetical protein
MIPSTHTHTHTHNLREFYNIGKNAEYKCSGIGVIIVVFYRKLGEIRAIVYNV